MRVNCFSFAVILVGLLTDRPLRGGLRSTACTGIGEFREMRYFLHGNSLSPAVEYHCFMVRSQCSSAIRLQTFAH